MATIITPDLCDEFPDVQVVEPGFRNYGGHKAFGGEIVTVKCFEDNSVVKEQVGLPGKGRVMVVDGGASKRHALLGHAGGKGREQRLGRSDYLWLCPGCG